MRYLVLEAGEPVGYAEVPDPDSADGTSFGDLEPLPGFERVQPVLQSAIRADLLLLERVEAARREGRLPPLPVPSGVPGQPSIIMYQVSPAELAVWGDDVHAARAARTRLRFSLVDADGRAVPTEDVRVVSRIVPGQIDPPQPPLVMVVFPSARESPEAEA